VSWISARRIRGSLTGRLSRCSLETETTPRLLAGSPEFQAKPQADRPPPSAILRQSSGNAGRGFAGLA